MKNFDMKKYFKNLVELEAISIKEPITSRPML